MKIKLLIFLICLIVLLLHSCSKKRIVTKFYTLDTPENVIEKAISKWAVNVMVDNFKISKTYDRTQIALRTDTNELQYYFYHKWSENPTTAVSYTAWKYLRASGLFNTCTYLGLSPQTDYVISGRIDQIERIENEEAIQAHIKMTLELQDYSTRVVQLAHSFDKYAMLPDDSNMNAFAQAIKITINTEMEVFTNKIQKFMEDTN